MTATALAEPNHAGTATATIPPSRPDVPGIDRATDLSIELLIAQRSRIGQVQEADRDDLAQHLRLALIEARPNFRPNQGAWPTFVRAVLRITMQDWLRERLRPSRNERLNQSIYSNHDQELAGWAADLADHRQPEAFARSEQREALRAVLSHLDTGDQRIAELLTRHTPTQVRRLLRMDSKRLYAAIRRVRQACIQAGVVA